ncbi:biosynthetic peptidoglycan transglycosylase [Streptomyces sp. NPDC006668]|uniref:biosynthetic peptidoglycan transglycosylase n=1 Tax=Streptomyces sp. NPDC006668 TaxID=3156903 RepID=UPI0033E2E8FA
MDDTRVRVVDGRTLLPPSRKTGRARWLRRCLAFCAGAGAAALLILGDRWFGYGLGEAGVLGFAAAVVVSAVAGAEVVSRRVVPGWLRRCLRAGLVMTLTAAVLCALCGGALLALTPNVSDAEQRVRALDAERGISARAVPTPPKVAEALVATEDSRFWRNPGIDPVGVARAVVVWLEGRGGDGGGATLEQQLAKMLYTNGGRTRTDQVEQVALGLKLAHGYPKSEILQMYLSVAYFGHGFYGLEAAARGYFDTTPNRLTWPQAALLAGLVQAPSLYDPLHDPQLARERRTQVLGRLVAVGDLPFTQARAYADGPLDLSP